MSSSRPTRREGIPYTRTHSGHFKRTITTEEELQLIITQAIVHARKSTETNDPNEVHTWLASATMAQDLADRLVPDLQLRDPDGDPDEQP